MRPGLITAAAFAALGLAACNNAETGRTAAGSRICTPFPEAVNTNANGQVAPAPVQPSDPAAAADDCLHRWGYTLAASPDPAEAVAQATVAACGPALTRWNQQGLTSAAPQSANGEPAPSLLTGQPTNPLTEHYTYAQSRALFYVVQARAGKCAPPPATTAAPAGNTTAP